MYTYVLKLYTVMVPKNVCTCTEVIYTLNSTEVIYTLNSYMFQPTMWQSSVYFNILVCNVCWYHYCMNVQSHVHNIPPRVPVLGQINPVHALLILFPQVP